MSVIIPEGRRYRAEKILRDEFGIETSGAWQKLPSRDFTLDKSKLSKEAAFQAELRLKGDE